MAFSIYHHRFIIVSRHNINIVNNNTINSQWVIYTHCHRSSFNINTGIIININEYWSIMYHLSRILSSQVVTAQGRITHLP